SRRRHTRFSRDWSSDVCSSDLAAEEQYRDLVARSADMDALVDRHARATERLKGVRAQLESAVTERKEAEAAVQAVSGLKAELDRSEERRVGKEWRARLSAYDQR